MRRGFVIGFLMIILSGLASPARAAGLVLYLQDSTVTAGGYGVLNIWIGNTDPTPNLFNTYSLELQITGPNFLEFAPNPASPSTATPQTQNYAYLSAGNYVFPGDSLFGLSDSNAGAPESGTSNTSFIAFDASNSGNTYSPPTSTPGVTLLASLVLYAAVTNPGETYQVNVVNGSNTYFNTNFDTSTNLLYNVQSISGYGGGVTIGASAVPEPASIILGLTGLAFVAGVARFGRIRRQG